ncbi:uncharacterized protein EV420DRAFT_131389 [Desarmillaria tabescens]|uniref:Pentacotripeptide-repeat region of PRORP domain-containing protein n=1 Tax=Armillaria tabescens TaxID=1929756 RepID=A0AA39TPD2_ARMTA|nr:uncharacterized protein EV420DRAFT_131389 [Desarmillaria tabescens]KAK0461818.1 hypothetical protein EV420DRAFT_131389 [Desarmillaria tabescens]
MLEPVATALFTSVLGGHIGQPSAFQAAARLMRRSSANNLTSDFFIPQPRRVKDKGKARATGFQFEQHECTPDRLSQCREWSCMARHSIWCSNHHRRLLMKEFPLVEDIPFRSRISTRIPATLHSYSSRRVAVRAHDGQRRHVSRTSKTGPPSEDSGVSSVADEGSAAVDASLTHPEVASEIPHDSSDSRWVLPSLLLPPDKSAQVIHSLHRVTLKPPDDFDIEEAWTVYGSVIEEHAKHLTSVYLLLQLVEHMLYTTGKWYDSKTGLEALHQWGDRIKHLLRTLESRILSPSRFHYTHCCLAARAHALTGEYELAAQYLQAARAYRECSPVDLIAMYQSIVLSKFRYYDVRQMVAYLLAEWDDVSAYLAVPPREPFPPNPVRRAWTQFFFAVTDLLCRVPDAKVLFAPEARLDVIQKQRIGNLSIQAHCARQRPLHAWEVFRAMRSQGLAPQLETHLALVRALTKEEAMGPAKKAFSYLDETHAKPYLSTALYLCAHDGDFERAEIFFDQLSQDDLVTREDTAMLMHSYAVHGKVEQVLHLFNEFFPAFVNSRGQQRRANDPRNVHYATVLYAYARNTDLGGIDQWLGVMHEAGIRVNVVMYTMILQAMAVKGDLEALGLAMKRMQSSGMKPTVATYTTLISTMAKMQDPLTAEKLYKKALEDGIKPNSRMINALMTAHAEAGSWRGVIKVFDYVRSIPHIPLTIDICNILLKAYVRIGAPFRIVARLFTKLQQSSITPDKYTYVLVILAACDAGLMPRATKLFEEMERLATSASDIKVTVHVMTMLMGGWLRMNKKKKGKAVYDMMVSRGIQPNSISFGEIQSAYGMERSDEGLKLAEEFIDTLMSAPPEHRTWLVSPRRGKTSMDHIYAPVLWGYSRKVQPRDVERMYQHMLDHGGTPSLGMVTALMDAYRRTMDINAVLQVWPQVFQLGLQLTQRTSVFGLDQDGRGQVRVRGDVLSIPLSIYMDALSRAALFTEVAAIWKRFQDYHFVFTSHNYNHLIIVLLRAGEIERAFEIVEKVILPYQRKYKVVENERDEHPETPLAFEEYDKILEQERKGDWGRERRESGKMHVDMFKREPWTEQMMVENAREYDYAHPLHILHQISPGWNIWRPHRGAMTALLMVLLRLKAGLLLEAMALHKRNPDEFPAQGREELLAEREESEALLNSLHGQFPDTIEQLRVFEIKEKSRLVSGFDKKYRQFVPR